MTYAWLYSRDDGLDQFIGINHIGHLIDFIISKKIVQMRQLIVDFARPNSLQVEDDGQEFEI